MEPNPYEAPKTQPESPSGYRVTGPASIVIAALQIAVGFTAGFSIWAATAPQEAWDANPLYSVLVLLSGLVASFARLREFYWGIVGVYLGQVVAVYLLIPIGGGTPIMPAILSVLFMGTPPAALGALIGAGLGYSIKLVRK